MDADWLVRRQGELVRQDAALNTNALFEYADSLLEPSNPLLHDQHEVCILLQTANGCAP